MNIARTRSSSAFSSSARCLSLFFSVFHWEPRSCLAWLGFHSTRARQLMSERHRADISRGQAGRAPVHLLLHQIHLNPPAGNINSRSLFFLSPSTCLSYKFTYAYLSWKWAEAPDQAQVRDKAPEREILLKVFRSTFLFRVDKHTRRMRNNLQNYYCAKAGSVNLSVLLWFGFGFGSGAKMLSIWLVDRAERLQWWKTPKGSESKVNI